MSQHPNARNSKNDRWENAIAVIVAVAGGLIVIVLRKPDKWLSAIFVTVVAFSGMLSFYRRRWPNLKFWGVIGLLFIAHLVAMWFIFDVMLRSRTDVSLLACVPGIFLESFVIYHFVGRVLGYQKTGA